jgi:hypothetical protein
LPYVASADSTPVRRIADTDIRTATALDGVLRGRTLDAFADAVSRSSGLGVGELPALTRLFVRTRNSVYRIDVLEPRDRVVLVQGGAFFPQPTKGWLNGSSFGGSCLKVGWIGVGLHLEFHANDRFIITSRVLSMDVERDSPRRPF